MAGSISITEGNSHLQHQNPEDRELFNLQKRLNQYHNQALLIQFNEKNFLLRKGKKGIDSKQRNHSMNHQ